MLAGYDTHTLAANRLELWRLGREAAVDREVIDLAGAGEAAELRDRALRLLAVGVGDDTPTEVQEQVAEITRRLAQLEAPPHWWE